MYQILYINNLKYRKQYFTPPLAGAPPASWGHRRRGPNQANLTVAIKPPPSRLTSVSWLPIARINGTAGIAITRRLQSIKGPQHLLQFVFGNVGAAIGYCDALSKLMPARRAEIADDERASAKLTCAVLPKKLTVVQIFWININLCNAKPIAIALYQSPELFSALRLETNSSSSNQ
jgi:hypothetical protein